MLEGNCGDKVVTRVRVGTGRRALVDGRGARVDVAVPLSKGQVEGRAQYSSALDVSLEWSEPQAWAIRVEAGNRGRDLIVVRMDEVLVDDAQFRPEVEVRRPMFLVVLYRDAQGHHGVILPRGPHRRPYAEGVLTLPSLTAKLPPGMLEAREALVVFGFTEEADFERWLPPAGDAEVQVVDAYVEALRAELESGALPPDRWDQAEFTYTIRSAEVDGA